MNVLCSVLRSHMLLGAGKLSGLCVKSIDLGVFIHVGVL
jgi:hypothetical protein